MTLLLVALCFFAVIGIAGVVAWTVRGGTLSGYVRYLFTATSPSRSEVRYHVASDALRRCTRHEEPVETPEGAL